MTSLRRPRGMTMLETMVVIAIVGILAAISIPGFMRMIRSARVSATARDIQGLVIGTRALAITRGMPSVLCLRGRAFGDATDGLPLTGMAWRKSVALPQALCVTSVCPPLPIDASNAAFNPLAVPPDMRITETSAEPGVSWTLPAADNQVFTMVFDQEGRVSGFAADLCGQAAVPAAVAPLTNAYTIRVVNDADATIAQDIVVRVDGTVVLP